MLPDVAGIYKENMNKKTAVRQRGKISEIFIGKEYPVTWKSYHRYLLTVQPL